VIKSTSEIINRKIGSFQIIAFTKTENSLTPITHFPYSVLYRATKSHLRNHSCEWLNAKLVL